MRNQIIAAIALASTLILTACAGPQTRPQGQPQSKTQGQEEAASPVCQSVMVLHSEPGDYIGQGQSWLISINSASSRLDRHGRGGTVMIELTGREAKSNKSYDDWLIAISGLEGNGLELGRYQNARRHPFNQPGTPGLSVSGEGRGSNNLYGEFTLFEVEYGPGGQVLKLAFDFVQHSERLSAPALRGNVRFHSSYPIQGEGTEKPTADGG